MIVRRDKSRHSSFMAMLDFLFNLVLAFCTLVILLLLVVKTESSKPGVENKNEFILTVQWDDNTNDDVDTWVMDPLGRVISFKNREQPGMFLQRDDVGRANKMVQSQLGAETTIPSKENPTNIEVVNFTSWLPGQYNVNLHLYRPDLYRQGNISVRVKLIKVNPFSEPAVLTIEIPRAEAGKQITALNFHVDEKGQIKSITRLPIDFVYSDTSSSGGPDYNPTPQQR